jgi:hypothetical protein
MFIVSPNTSLAPLAADVEGGKVDPVLEVVIFEVVEGEVGAGKETGAGADAVVTILEGANVSHC